jgi:hypothetical protein
MKKIKWDDRFCAPIVFCERSSRQLYAPGQRAGFSANDFDAADDAGTVDGRASSL